VLAAQVAAKGQLQRTFNGNTLKGSFLQ